MGLSNVALAGKAIIRDSRRGGQLRTPQQFYTAIRWQTCKRKSSEKSSQNENFRLFLHQYFK